MSFVPRSLHDEAHEWPEALAHLSASSFKMLVRCPEQWRQRYLLGKKAPPALALLAGGADHAAIQLSMEQKVDSFADLPLPTVKERFVEELESRVENAGGIGEVEIRGASDRPAKMREYDTERKVGPEVVAAYHTKVSPTLQPVAVEQSFSIDIPGVPVPVIGYIDLVAGPVQETLLEPGKLTIIERKRRQTAKRKPEPDWTMQGEVYQLFVPEPYAFHISVNARGEPYVLTPTTVPELQVALAPRKRSELLVQQIAAEIGFYYVRYGPELPWPAKGKLHPWACNYCGYREDCWGWKQ
jgi:CRISPR/Cas system-associated exonuclease Cas4 (RecB family)